MTSLIGIGSERGGAWTKAEVLPTTASILCFEKGRRCPLTRFQTAANVVVSKDSCYASAERTWSGQLSLFDR